MTGDEEIPDVRVKEGWAVEYVTSRFNVYFLMAMGVIGGVLFLAGFLTVPLWDDEALEELRALEHLPDPVVLMAIGIVSFCLFIPWFIASFFARHFLMRAKRLERQVEELRALVDALYGGEPKQ